MCSNNLLKNTIQTNSFLFSTHLAHFYYIFRIRTPLPTNRKKNRMIEITLGVRIKVLNELATPLNVRNIYTPVVVATIEKCGKVMERE